MNEIEVLKQYGKIKSFGNRTLNENVILAKKAIEELAPLKKIFDRPHSQFQTMFFIVGKDATPHRSIRQICAEITNKEEALLENIHKLSLEEVDIDEMKEKLLTEKNNFEQRRLQLKINNGIINRERALNPIQATLKDILLLKAHYDSMYEKMTEYQVEKSECGYWIMRIASQAMRHIRLYGKINEGNQLAFEEIGINPTYMEKRLLQFLQKEQSDLRPDLKLWYNELQTLVKELIDVPNQYAKIRKMNLGINKDAIFEEDFESD